MRRVRNILLSFLYKLWITSVIYTLILTLSLYKHINYGTMKRYFFCLSVKEIVAECSLSSTNVKAILHRVRKKLKIYLEKEGFFI